ncbi:Diacylglycerol kinase family enzyme [Burkholderia sp. YR290]|uniref:diacylglycerol/lipid kinase family protein n=1 Tax=Paraburkholderia hospita TaxID=169430 RepID=UPI0009A6DFE1|nr:diacylglycerol kinase family protein [Paraburkholderia hospita]SKD01330.1 Diacylglycerol kinase family enzyme [Paraburkholderia hospita]SOE84004.1 Diacylglycerol kinase family enzyme [Burkholderia sp. YR290]
MTSDARPSAIPAHGEARQMDARAPFVIVMNAGSGRKQGETTAALIANAFGKANREYELMLVDDPSQLGATAQRAVELAQARGGAVVGAGGDGTLCAVAQAVIGSGCAFGVLPCGTFNYFSRDHGIPADPAQAVDLLLTARAHPVQVGFVNDRMFLVNASLGLYPKMLEHREIYKRQFGRSRIVALWSAVAMLLRRHRHLRLHVDHEGTMQEIRTSTLFVANNRLQLEQVGAAEAPLLAQGLLVALAPRAIGRIAQIVLSLHGALSRMSDADNVIGFAFRRFTVTHPSKRRRRVKIAMDGEVTRMQMPLEFRVGDTPLYLLKPEADVAALNRS